MRVVLALACLCAIAATVPASAAAATYKGKTKQGRKAVVTTDADGLVERVELGWEVRQLGGRPDQSGPELQRAADATDPAARSKALAAASAASASEARRASADAPLTPPLVAPALGGAFVDAIARPRVPQ